MTNGSDDRSDLIDLLNLPDKRAVEKFCRERTITKDDLSQVLWGARLGALEPYKYACHFDEIVPPHLIPTPEDHRSLVSNGVGPMKPGALKMMRKVTQIFQDRRLFAGHLLYLPGGKIWHLIYFDQRDMNREGNHWKKGGAHIHYSRESFVNVGLDEVWKQICQKPPAPPLSVHVRYFEEPHRGEVDPADRVHTRAR